MQHCAYCHRTQTVENRDDICPAAAPPEGHHWTGGIFPTLDTAGNAIWIPSDKARAAVADALNPKDAQGAAKPQMGLVPVGAMEAVARVMELGAKKYGPYNWRTKPVRKMVYAHAALRHLFAWIGGQDTDPESGQSHLAHVAACMFIVLDANTVGAAVEDRDWLVKKAD